MIKQANRRAINPQGGMVLVTSLLLLIVVTLLAIGMFRSFGLDEKIAGNVREKQRALNAAETAEEYAEYWLAHGNSSNGVACSGGIVPSATAQVCSNLLVAPTQIPWPAGYSYLPTVTSAMSISANGGLGTYLSAPAFYIGYLGPTPNGLGSIYQIDAVGYGGSVDTAAVVEATYIVQSSTKDLGGL
jgi:type IV pilus assembly protein PilX